MANLEVAQNDPRKLLWNELSNVPAAMLSIDDTPDHAQPMAPLIDPDNDEILFFTRKSSDLIRHVGVGVRGRVIVIGKQHDFHASLSGALVQVSDRNLIEKFWNPVAAAWYADGQTDPDLAMLRFDPLEGVIWASSNSSLTFGWEIIKANLTTGEPDLGVRRHIAF